MLYYLLLLAAGALQGVMVTGPVFDQVVVPP